MRYLGIVLAFQLALPTLAHPERFWSERSNPRPFLTQLPDFKALAAQVVPAVVSLKVGQRVQMRRGGGGGSMGGFQDPFEFFYRYFGGEMPREFQQQGLASGFVIHTSGLILTNAHVVEDAETIEVIFQQADGSEQKISARVLGTAPEYDVALLKTDKTPQAPTSYLGNSDAIGIGEWVMAVGNPFGLSHTVSVGIISARERRNVEPSGRHGVYNFLQTDAAINLGNSGGPLVNMAGEVIGINTAINAAGSGIGFAIPINMVKNILPDLQTKGTYTRSWIGISVQPLDLTLAQSYGLPKAMGVLITAVAPHSPASEAKLLDGDIILQFDGKDLHHPQDLLLWAGIAGVGKTVSLKIWRNAHERTVRLTLQALPSYLQPSASKASKPNAEKLLGMAVMDITPVLQRQFHLDVAQGVVITEVQSQGVADRAGLQPGDVVLSIQGQTMKTAKKTAAWIHKASSGELLRLKINRHGNVVFVALRKP